MYGVSISWFAFRIWPFLLRDGGVVVLPHTHLAVQPALDKSHHLGKVDEDVLALDILNVDAEMINPTKDMLRVVDLVERVLDYREDVGDAVLSDEIRAS